MPFFIAAVIAITFYEAHQAMSNKTSQKNNFLVYLYALFLRLHAK